MAQLVEQRIRNAQAVGSSPTSSSMIWRVVRVVEGAALEMLCTQVPRVRIPNSPPSRVFITDSSCEHSIFLFQLYFRAGVMPALFVFYGQFYAGIFFEIYSTATPDLIASSRKIGLFFLFHEQYHLLMKSLLYVLLRSQ